jgi:hypothetical protein
MVENDGHLGTKKDQKYHCERCDYTTSHLGKWKRHIDTKKHKMSQMVDNGGHLGTKRDRARWVCTCGKEYKYNQGYYRHKKTCSTYLQCNESFASSGLSKDDVIDILKAVMPAITESIGGKNAVICSGSNNNINNQEVSVNLYLNEKCADAMSIQGFAQQLSVTVADLLKNGKPIAREGVSNILIDNLRPLAVEDRPIHCVDAGKRSWHVKDAVEGWRSGESGAADVVTAANFNISKSLGKLWDETYPGWENDGQKTEQFHTLCQMLMDDPTASEIEKVLESIGPECKLSIEDIEKFAVRPKKTST